MIAVSEGHCKKNFRNATSGLWLVASQEFQALALPSSNSITCNKATGNGTLPRNNNGGGMGGSYYECGCRIMGAECKQTNEQIHSKYC